MLGIALPMLTHNKPRLIVAILGTTAAFYLTASVIGLLVGWCNTNSALITHAGADVWIMAVRTAAFDYGTPIPRTRLYQVRSVKGVEWAEPLIVTWGIWKGGDGERVSVELVGLDLGRVGGPWELAEGELEAISRPGTVVVDDLYLKALGVGGIGDRAEIHGMRAQVGAISRGVRTFTASPFVFMSSASLIEFDGHPKGDEITYVLARCAPGYSAEEVRDAIAREVPHVEALTTSQFAARTISYWMLGTGAGISVVLTAILGLVIGTIITSQTLFAVTNDHLKNYATLLALGFSRSKLSGVVAVQSLVLGGGGVCIGASLFLYAIRITARTPIPLETTGLVLCGLIGLMLTCCVMASFVSIRTVFRIDPVTVFEA